MSQFENIKGSCENCGFHYEGSVLMKDGVFPIIFCPQCGKETQNFDSAAEVEKNDRAEGVTPIYNHVEQFTYQFH